MATTADMRSGLILKIENNLYTVIEFGQNKTARAAAKVWAKLKGVDNSRTIEITWNSGETIYPVRVEKKAYQYLYIDDTGYSFGQLFFDGFILVIGPFAQYKIGLSPLCELISYTKFKSWIVITSEHLVYMFESIMPCIRSIGADS